MNRPIHIYIGGTSVVIQRETAFYLESLLDPESLIDEWNGTDDTDVEDADALLQQRMKITGEIELVRKAFKKYAKK